MHQSFLPESHREKFHCPRHNLSFLIVRHSLVRIKRCAAASQVQLCQIAIIDVMMSVLFDRISIDPHADQRTD
jgi:hypothetical protein